MDQNSTPNLYVKEKLWDVVRRSSSRRDNSGSRSKNKNKQGKLSTIEVCQHTCQRARLTSGDTRKLPVNVNNVQLGMIYAMSLGHNLDTAWIFGVYKCRDTFRNTQPCFPPCTRYYTHTSAETEMLYCYCMPDSSRSSTFITTYCTSQERM